MTSVEVCSGVVIPVIGVCLDPLVAIGSAVVLAIGGFILFQSVVAWVRSMFLRLALHHVLFGAVGAAGIGIETLVDGGLVGVLSEALDWVIGTVL